LSASWRTPILSFPDHPKVDIGQRIILVGNSPKAFIIQGFGQFLRGLTMPIYAYRCDACGFAKDVLQKVSDPVLTDCPSCSKSTFKKQLTAAGFQLKGTGWYVTDFRNGAGKPAPASTSEKPSTESASASANSGAEADVAPAASASSTDTTASTA
jgi:putative FmdB family regulatory protein